VVFLSIIVVNAIVGKRCRIEQCGLEGALLGDEARVTGLRGSASLGSHAEMRA